MVVPFRSAVEAFFLLHLSVPAAVFAARWDGRMERGLGRGRFALDARRPRPGGPDLLALPVAVTTSDDLWTGRGECVRMSDNYEP
jgi:hypothetical protein